MTTTAPQRADTAGAPQGAGRPPGGTGARIAAVVAIVVGVAAVAGGVIGPGAIVVSLPFLYLLVRRPVLRRLALRNAARRPRETALVVLGALLGTAIITSSYVVGDTLRASIRRSAYTQLGPVDELVATTADHGPAVVAAVRRANLPAVDGVLPLTTLQASVSSTGPDVKAEPRAQVIETDFTAARAFGGNPAATGISGSTPAPGEAVVGEDLAQTLDVRAGDDVVVHAFGTQQPLRVTRIVPRIGVAGLLTLDGANLASPNIFVAPGTIAALQKNATTAHSNAASQVVSLVAVSNDGNVVNGVQHTPEVSQALTNAVDGLPARVVPVKQNLLDTADRQGKSFTSFFQNFGYFSVLAGILLLVNIFVMLAEERKTTLGMLRAVGLRRSSLVGSFSLEGWLYALAAAATGAVVGIGIGRLVVVLASKLFEQGRTTTGAGLQLHFAVRRVSVRAGFTVGFLIALITVVATSLYIARLNVIRAIRDLPEPPTTGRHLGRRVAAAVIAVLGLIMTISGVAGNKVALALIGPAALGFGLIVVLGPYVPRRPLVSFISIAVIAWAIFSVSVVNGNRSIGVFVVQGMILTGYAIALVTQNQEQIGAALRAVGGGARNMSLRLGLAYPLARRFRTGLTLAMYAIVVFVLTLLITISSLFGGQEAQFVAKLAGGSTIVVESNAADPVPAAGVRSLPGISAVAATSSTAAEFPKPGSPLTTPVKVVGFGPDFIANGAPKIDTGPPGVTTDRGVFEQVLAKPGTVLVSGDFTLGARGNGPGGGGSVNLGQTILMRDPVTGKTTPLTVAGFVKEARYGGFEHVYVSNDTAQRAFGPRATPNLLFLTTKPATDNERLAASINGRYLANGADANSFHHLVATQFTQQQQFLGLIKGYVALGLLVGIAGLGVIMVRAVRERRRQIGVLRALGFGRVAIRRAFVTESSFIALEGIVIGASLALVTAWRLVTANALGDGIAFGVPWLQLLPWLAGAFVASLLATASPAQQAARIRPAVALRIAD
jgi:putative ABC transport system permease protein